MSAGFQKPWVADGLGKHFHRERASIYYMLDWIWITLTIEFTTIFEKRSDFNYPEPNFHLAIPLDKSGLADRMDMGQVYDVKKYH